MDWAWEQRSEEEGINDCNLDPDFNPELVNGGNIH